MKMKRVVFLIIVFFTNALVAVVNGQERTVTGIVRDINTHREISNVNIFIKGTQVGTTSNVSGYYDLQIPRGAIGAIIIFRHIGYEIQEIPLDSLVGIRYVFLQPRVIPLQGVQIEETRDRLIEIEKDIPQTVSMVESKTFEIRGYVDAGDLLKVDHSVQVEEELSGKKTVSIRGGNPDEIVVLYNGIKLNRAYDNTFDLSLIDLEDIERFEIIKGSNTALYGPEAFSGVINIVPKLQRDYFIRFQQRFGTYRSGNWGLHLYHKLNRLHGSYSHKQGGWKRQFMGVEEGQAGLENTSLHHTANLSYSFSENPYGTPKSSLGAMYMYTSLQYDNQRDVESLSNFNELLSLQFDGDVGGLKDLDLSISFVRFEEDQFLAAGTGSLNRSIKDRGIHVDADKKLTFGLADLLFAYQFQYTEFDFTDVRTSFREQNVGLESALFERLHHGFATIGKLHGDIRSDFLQKAEINVSLRHDRVTDRQSNPVLRSQRLPDRVDENPVGLFDTKDWNETMFKFALNLLGYRQDITFNGYISFGVNTKFPTLCQMISSPLLITEGAFRASLNPEKNRSTELSFSVARDIRGHRTLYGWEVSGNFFLNYYDNKFRVSSTPGIPVPFYDNVPNARISGFETKSSLFLFRKKVAVELGMSKYFISERAAFPFKSDYKHTLSFSIDHAGYSFQIQWFKEGEQAGWIRQQNSRFAEITLPDFSNIDLHLSKTFQVWRIKLFVNASGRNLLNDKEVILQGLAIRDRRFYLTLGTQY
ncbi:MAG: TonB-dependent receptor plug domain-containing protein [bacterium]